MDVSISDLLHKYVQAGGILVFGARTGYKDQFGRCPMITMPGLVSKWCGVTVEEYTLSSPDEEDMTVTWDQKQLPAPVFHEVLQTTSTDVEILAVFDSSFYEGKPALCRRKINDGQVYYLGACFSVDMVKAILSDSNNLSPYKQIISLPETVELAVRTDGLYDYAFLLNYKNSYCEIEIHTDSYDLLHKNSCKGKITLAPFETAVYRFTQS
jgi:beta-galactosidase